MRKASDESQFANENETVRENRTTLSSERALWSSAEEAQRLLAALVENRGDLIGLASLEAEALQRTWAEMTHPDDVAADVALFNSIDEGFCTIQVLFDENNKPIDYRFLEVNPSFEKQTGIENAQGRRMREIAPQHEEHWFEIFEIYGKIALTASPRDLQTRQHSCTVGMTSLPSALENRRRERSLSCSTT
jgi:PAS domain-containing protein